MTHIEEEEETEEGASAMEIDSVGGKSKSGELDTAEFAAKETEHSGESSTLQLMETATEETARQLALAKLFHGCRMFVSREVPRQSLVFVVRAMGGTVSWCATVAGAGPFTEDDSSVTHEIVDRPFVSTKYDGRVYVQPQWVYDCINAQVRKRDCVWVCMCVCET